jgi:hypothetical protein
MRFERWIIIASCSGGASTPVIIHLNVGEFGCTLILRLASIGRAGAEAIKVINCADFTAVLSF